MKYPENATTPQERVDKLVTTRHASYYNQANAHALFYYILRVTAGLAAGALPFAVVTGCEAFAITLSLVVMVTTVLDLVFNPKDRWLLFSGANRSLTRARLDAEDQYEPNRKVLDIVLATEAGILRHIMNADDLLNQVRRPDDRSESDPPPKESSSPLSDPSSGKESENELRENEEKEPD